VCLEEAAAKQVVIRPGDARPARVEGNGAVQAPFMRISHESLPRLSLMRGQA
jgi:hypothetical protein